MGNNILGSDDISSAKKHNNEETGNINGNNSGREVFKDEPPQNLISSRDVEVNIRCSIGNVNISINELLNLKLGDVVEFCRWPATVKLSVNNRYFAEGILVEIEGLLGVKLTKKLLNIN